MLRTRVRTDPRQLRQLFDNLSRLKKERSVTLNELPIPFPGKPTAPPPPKSIARARARTQPLQKFNSVSALQSAAENDDQDWRVFEQVDETPKFIAVPNSPPTRQLPPVNDHAAMVDRTTGLDVVFATLRLADGERFLLRKLMNAMMCANQPTPGIVKEVFFWLQRVAASKHLLKLLTPYAWKFLWALDVSTVPTLRSKMLGDLMVDLGVPLTENQEVGYIGGMFWHDSREQAIQRWEDLANRTPTSTVWNLGIRLFSLERNPVQAEAVLDAKIDMLGMTEHNTWIPITMAYNHIYQSDKAWESYEKMQSWAKRNGATITTSQYDDLAMSFLDSYQPGMGLEIYKHMLYSGNPTVERTQTETYKNLASAIKEAQDASDNHDELNKISCEALQTLPTNIANKYFFGGWMKNLMKMGRTDLAWFIVRDVMPSGGIRADSIHWNWVIQGFLEEGEEELAERIANQLIHERMRRDGNVPPEEQSEPKVYQAPATIQTFSLLINYHARRHRMDHVVSVCTKMLECNIQTNSYVMNHMLFALFRTHDMSRLSNAFVQMTTTGGVNPDQESFLIMWTALYKRYTMNSRKFIGFLTPRELFRHTIKKLPPPTKDHRNISRRIRMWHIMIKSFMLARDLEGALIALHAGAKLLRLPIDDKIVRETALGVMKIRAWDPSRTGGQQAPVDAQTLESSVSRLQALGEHLRRLKLRKRGRFARKPRLAPEDGTLDSLSKLLNNELGQSDLVVDRLAKARAEMGLDGKKLGIVR